MRIAQRAVRACQGVRARRARRHARGPSGALLGRGRRAGRARRCSLIADPAQRLGLPASAGAGPTQGSPRERAVLAEQQVAQRAPGEVRGGDPLADVAAGPGQPAGRARRRPTRTSRGPPRGRPTRRARAPPPRPRGTSPRASPRRPVTVRAAVVPLAVGAPSRSGRARLGPRSRSARRRSAAGTRTRAPRRPSAPARTSRSAPTPDRPAAAVTIIELLMRRQRAAPAPQRGGVALGGTHHPAGPHGRRPASRRRAGAIESTGVCS